jgi:hypothetical protein
MLLSCQLATSLGVLAADVFAQKSQTLPQMTLITLIYTDQQSSTGSF